MAEGAPSNKSSQELHRIEAVITDIFIQMINEEEFWDDFRDPISGIGVEGEKREPSNEAEQLREFLRTPRHLEKGIAKILFDGWRFLSFTSRKEFHGHPLEEYYLVSNNKDLDYGARGLSLPSTLALTFDLMGLKDNVFKDEEERKFYKICILESLVRYTQKELLGK